MTFNQLLTELRTRKLNESTTDFFGDSVDLLPMLGQAALVIGSVFGIPRKDATGNTTAGADITPPSDFLNVTPNGVYVAGLALRRVSTQQLEFYKLGGQGTPRYYAFDPAKSGNIKLAPLPSAALAYTFEYQVKLPDPDSVVGTDQPWLGTFPQFHDVVALYATVLAYEKGQTNYDSAAYWVQRFQARMRDFAIYLDQAGYQIPDNFYEKLGLPAAAAVNG